MFNQCDIDESRRVRVESLFIVYTIIGVFSSSISLSVIVCKSIGRVLETGSIECFLIVTAIFRRSGAVHLCHAIVYRLRKF